jgi:hypothetical protein
MSYGINYFVGQSKTWLEDQLEKCQEDMAWGKSLIQWGAGDSSGISRVQLSPEERWKRIYYALSELDSTTYPPIKQVTRTKAAFS